MITVCMLKNRDKVIGFEAKGHALYGEQDQDIVCSAVSALIQTAVLGLKERLQLPIGYEMDDGYTYCVLGQEINIAQHENAELIMDTMLLGLKSIEAEYGNYLSITQREV